MTRSSRTGQTPDGGRRRRARARWAVPAAAVAAVALGVTAAAVVPQLAGASTGDLPTRTAQQLLAAAAATSPRALSGTVVETAALGLPELPGSGSSTSLTSLAAGSHTLRVWFGSGQRQRIAVLGSLAETDLIRDGSNAWIWSSSDNSAQHLLLPATPTGGATRTSTPTPSAAASLSPQLLAAKLLAAVDPSTQVSTVGTTTVADRAAYELQIRPRDNRSLINRVVIAVDARTSTPLRVQVYAGAGTGSPAFSTGFTSLSLTEPDASIFAFTPPPGATVTTTDLRSLAQHHGTGTKDIPPAGADTPVISGTGWTSVAEIPAASTMGATTSASGQPSQARHQAASVGSDLQALLAAATPVSGSFGTGRVLSTALVSVLILDNGKVFVGAVTPSVLEQTATP